MGVFSMCVYLCICLQHLAVYHDGWRSNEFEDDRGLVNMIRVFGRHTKHQTPHTPTTLLDDAMAYCVACNLT